MIPPHAIDTTGLVVSGTPIPCRSGSANSLAAHQQRQYKDQEDRQRRQHGQGSTNTGVGHRACRGSTGGSGTGLRQRVVVSNAP